VYGSGSPAKEEAGFSTLFQPASRVMPHLPTRPRQGQIAQQQQQQQQCAKLALSKKAAITQQRGNWAALVANWEAPKRPVLDMTSKIVRSLISQERFDPQAVTARVRGLEAGPRALCVRMRTTGMEIMERWEFTGRVRRLSGRTIVCRAARNQTASSSGGPIGARDCHGGVPGQAALANRSAQSAEASRAFLATERQARDDDHVRAEGTGRRSGRTASANGRDRGWFCTRTASEAWRVRAAVPATAALAVVVVVVEQRAWRLSTWCVARQLGRSPWETVRRRATGAAWAVWPAAFARIWPWVRPVASRREPVSRRCRHMPACEVIRASCSGNTASEQAHGREHCAAPPTATWSVGPRRVPIGAAPATSRRRHAGAANSY
jgi:hypothetical protein